MGATVSDSQYDTEFWFDAAGYTVLDWKGNFSSEAKTRKAFDAWLNSEKAAAFDAGFYGRGINPYRPEGDE